jgi:hypothetical protein
MHILYIHVKGGYCYELEETNRHNYRFNWGAAVVAGFENLINRDYVKLSNPDPI